MPSADNYVLLIEKINTFIRKYYFNSLLRGLIFLGAGLFSAYLVITLTEYFGNFNTLLRTALFYGFIFINLCLLAGLVVPPLLAYLRLGKTITHQQAAEIIGLHFTDVKDKLLNTLQLKQLAEADVQHRQLIEASISQKIEALQPVSFPSAISLKENSKHAKWVALPLSAILIIAAVAPAMLTESTRRLIRHNEYFAPAAPFQFIIMNPALQATQGEDLKLHVRLKGNRLPAEVYAEVAGQSFRLTKENTSRFNYLFTNLQQNTVFRLSANGHSSALYEIKVTYKPSLLHFNVQLTYPAYLNKKSETLANAGELSIPAGTQVKWQLNTKNSTGVNFSVNGISRQAAAAGRDRFVYSARLIHDTRYTITPIGGTGAHSDSAAYAIHVIADEAPAINVQQVTDSVSLKAFYFNGDVRDDHGLSALSFFCIAGNPDNPHERIVIRKPVKADLSRPQASFFYYLNTADLAVKPGSHLACYFEVTDNDAVNGPKKVRSALFNLQIPDARQLNEQLNAGTQSVKDKMQSAAKMAAQLERETKQLNQQLFNKTSLSFDEKKQLETLMQKHRDLNELVKTVQEENKKNAYNRQENQQQDAALTAKQKEMEQLLNNMLDDKTQDMLKKLQNLLDQNQKDAAREQLTGMQADNQSLKKDLNRMLELYKKLDFDQKINQSINQLNQLAQQQQQLAAETGANNADRQQLQKQQQQLQQELQNINKGLAELSKANEQLEQKTDFKNPEQESRQAEQQMDISAGQLKKDNKNRAQQAQQQAAHQLQQMAGSLKQQNQESEAQQNQLNLQQLRELEKNLVNSSFEQEKLMQQLKGISSNNPQYVTIAQQQKDIKDNLKTAEDSLYSLSLRVPQIQSTVNQEVKSINGHIEEALTNLDDRRTPEAAGNQQYAMASMNNLALMLSEVISQVQNMMKNAKPGSGKKQGSLQQLSQMQQQLNQRMQQMREQLQQQGNQGKSAAAGQSEQLARMARQQAAIRQALEKYSQDEGGQKDGAAGSLNKIARDMEQTESDIVNKKITNESLLRQQQIHSRLLEADKAEQQREQDKQRESNAGRQMPPGYIKALESYRQQKVKQTELLQTVPPALNLYFKQRVTSYFNQLNAH